MNDSSLSSSPIAKLQDDIHSSLSSSPIAKLQDDVDSSLSSSPAGSISSQSVEDIITKFAEQEEKEDEESNDLLTIGGFTKFTLTNILDDLYGPTCSPDRIWYICKNADLTKKTPLLHPYFHLESLKGVCLFETYGIKYKNYELAFQYFSLFIDIKSLQNSYDLYSLYYISLCYECGYGCKQSLYKAYLIRKHLFSILLKLVHNIHDSSHISEKLHHPSINGFIYLLLAYCYKYGYGLSNQYDPYAINNANIPLSLQTFKKSAEYENNHAFYEIANIIEQYGLNGNQNNDQNNHDTITIALSWYKKAANCLYQPAKFALKRIKNQISHQEFLHDKKLHESMNQSIHDNDDFKVIDNNETSITSFNDTNISIIPSEETKNDGSFY